MSPMQTSGSRAALVIKSGFRTFAAVAKVLQRLAKGGHSDTAARNNLFSLRRQRRFFRGSTNDLGSNYADRTWRGLPNNP
jgi:hypothetical protein